MLLPHPADIAAAAAAQAPNAALTATRATAFLRGQAQWLQRGLSSSSDRVAVGIVLGAHDRSHDRWVVLSRTVAEHLGTAAAAEFDALYALVGRIAGSLERGALERLCPAVARDVRELLGQRLLERTETVVEHLWRAAAEA